MDKKNLQLKEFIKKLVKEYTGTGASGGNAGDGNNITSPRPFNSDTKEMENYILKNVYGAEGGQWVGDKVGSNPNRHPNVRFESLKKYIKDVLEEIEEQAYGSATLTTQGQSINRAPGVWEEDEDETINEQVTQAAQRTYEAGLKRLQKGVLRYQIRWIEKQRSAAVSQAATANQEASKGFEEQIKAIQDQIAAIDNPQQAQQGGEQQNESLLKNYINERSHQSFDGNVDLMIYMDSYKRSILLEGTVKELFKKFGKGNSNEDIIKKYASQGIQVPEQFISKVRKQYESLKKLKLEMDFAEQESKDVMVTPNIIPNSEPEIESKELSSRLYNEEEIQEAKITKRFELPPEIQDALVDKLKLDPLIRFVKSLKAVNSIPPSYRVFLLNGQDFFIYYEADGLMAKIGIDEYYLNHFQELNYAIKHINKLLTQPKMRSDDSEEEDSEGGGEAPDGPPPTPPGAGGPPPPPMPTGPKPPAKPAGDEAPKDEE